MAQAPKTVRVFISSTFRDMHAERDYLVRMVFPELRERCARQRIHLVDVDLRWGVTEEEAERGKVVEVILDEIDRSRPFFVAILGERYGSIPDEVPDDTEFAHPWLRDYLGHSLTALEIVHGVLRNPDLAKRSFFYFRDPQFISQVPESNQGDYEAESPEAALKLTTLKDKIRASGRPVMENYPCRWDNTQGRLVDLDGFGNRVLEDLWMAICSEYPEEVAQVDPLTIERQGHEAFAEERSRLHVGRVAEAARLTEYVQGTDRRPVVITGESGCGKSAFLASWYRRYVVQNPDDFVLAYFIGATPDSTQHLRLLRNMCAELKRQFVLKEEIPEDDKKLSGTLAVLLVAASRNKPRIVLVLDALDQLLSLEGTRGLGWLLDYMPEGVRLLVSSLEGDCLDVLRRRKAQEIALPPLTLNEQRQIVTVLLSEWRRKLDDKQTAALLAHPGVRNPLYLRVALEELRLFGKFEQLTARIKELSDDIPGLLDQVLARLEEDHGRELVTEAFPLLGCSRYGLSEVELLDLLPKKGEGQFPRVLWARLARGAKSYLVQRGELIGFFHRQLAEAVAIRYISKDNKHTKLAAYFASAPIERKLDEYPYQLQHAEHWEGLAAALSDLDFFDYAWEHKREYEWMEYWRSLEGHSKPGPCYQSAIDARLSAESETKDIARLLRKIGDLLHIMGLRQDALPFAERALAICALGTNHADVAASLNSLANVYRSLRWYGKALVTYQRALVVGRIAFGDDHPDMATTLNDLAEMYYYQGEYEKALPLLQRAQAIRESIFGTEHLGVAEILGNLGALFLEQGNYTEGIRLLRRAMVIVEQAMGLSHPIAVHMLANIANADVYLGKTAEAIRLHLHALRRSELAFGYRHPQTKHIRWHLVIITGMLVICSLAIVGGIFSIVAKPALWDKILGSLALAAGISLLLFRLRLVFSTLILMLAMAPFEKGSHISVAPDQLGVGSLFGILVLLGCAYFLVRLWTIRSVGWYFKFSRKFIETPGESFYWSMWEKR